MECWHTQMRPPSQNLSYGGETIVYTQTKDTRDKFMNLQKTMLPNQVAMVKHLYTYTLTHMYIHTPLTNDAIIPCSSAANYAVFLDGVDILLLPLLSSCMSTCHFGGGGGGLCNGLSTWLPHESCHRFS